MKTLIELMKMIDLQEEVTHLVIKEIENIDFKQLEEDIQNLMDISKAAEAKDNLKSKLGEDAANIKILTCMLYSLIYVYQTYQNMGIDDQIFIDTMKAFTRFIDEHYQGNKKWAFDRDWWTYRQLSMTIFRIGELEYEMKDIDGKKFISIHIPSDANLKHNKVLESLHESFVFFERFYPDFYKVEYSCRSWLLSSDLKKLLSEESNIIKFQNLFTIVSEKYGSYGFIKWIYKTHYTNYEELPEDTSLQRNLKQYLLAGNEVSVAYGIIDFTKLTNLS